MVAGSAQTASTSGTRAGVSRSAFSRRASRITSCALGGSGGRGGRRRTISCSPRTMRYVTFECPSPIGLASIAPAPRPWASRKASSGSSASSGGRASGATSERRRTMSSGATDRVTIGTLHRRSATRRPRIAISTWRRPQHLVGGRVIATMPKIPFLPPSRVRALVAAVAGCAALGAAGATPVLASHGQLTFFEAPRQLENTALRAKTFKQLQLLGVKALRVELHWNEAAPSSKSRRRPHFDATNPSSYNWGQIPAVLYQAQRLNWPVLLTVTGFVPKWATAAHNDMVTRPDDKFFEEFMTAVGRRLGSEVTYWALWNEPNIPGWLSPQFNSNGTPASPRLYRGLFQSGYKGLQAAGLASPKVFFGETAPFGVDSIRRGESTKQEMSPLVFMREALCLNSSYHKASTCSTLPIYGYA